MCEEAHYVQVAGLLPLSSAFHDFAEFLTEAAQGPNFDGERVSTLFVAILTPCGTFIHEKIDAQCVKPSL